MNLSDLRTDVLKAAITGLLAFWASCVYTDYRTDPGHNLTIMPLKIRPLDYCRVDSEKLERLVTEERPAQPANGTDPQPGDQKREYLRVLWQTYLQEKRPTDFTVPRNWILESAGGPELLSELTSENLLDCKGVSANARPILIDALALLDTPMLYVLDRSCDITVDDKRIPVFLDDTVISNPTESSSRSTLRTNRDSPITFKESSHLVLRYDPSLQDDVAKNDVLYVVDRAKADENSQQALYNVKVECWVIERNGPSRVGGDWVFSFRGQKLDKEKSRRMWRLF